MAKQRKDSNRGNPKLRRGDNPHGFKKGFDERRNLSGPPPKLSRLKVLEAALGGTIEPEFDRRITDRLKLWLSEMTIEELKRLIKRTDLSAMVLSYAKRIVAEHKSGETAVFEEIYDRAFGRPTSKTAFTNSEGDDTGGGLIIYLPDNGRGDNYQTEGNLAPETLNKPEAT